MNLLATLLGWIPRVLLFALAALIQVALIAVMVYDRVRVLREGSEVTLQTRPVDPRDFLRGDYVVLNYEITTCRPASSRTRRARAAARRSSSSSRARTDGVYEAVSVHSEPVPVGDGRC